MFKIKNLFLCTVGWALSEEELEQVANYDQPSRKECERLIPVVRDITPEKWTDAFLYIRENFTL